MNCGFVTVMGENSVILLPRAGRRKPSEGLSTLYPMSERPPASSSIIKLAWCCLLASVIVAALLFPVAGGIGLMSNRASDIVANGSAQLLEGDIPAVSTMVDGVGPLSAGLEGLGIRWVALHSTLEISDHGALFVDPGLNEVIRTPDIVLFEVASWRGAFVTPTGEAVPSTRFGEFAAEVDGRASDAVVWNHPAGPGWRLGGVAAEATSDGLVYFERSEGVAWNVATPLAVLAAAATLVATFVVAVRDRRRRRNLDCLAFGADS